MTNQEKKYPYDKRIYTKHLREPLDSFNTFNIWLQHPNWTLKKLSEETGIKYQKIKIWSHKYKYFQRRTDKEADEWRTINRLNMEAKIAAVQMAAARNMKLQAALNARAEITMGKNIEMLQKREAGILSDAELETIDRHTTASLKIENQQLMNNKLIDDIAATVAFDDDTATRNEFSRISEILQISRQNVDNESKDDNEEANK